MDQKIKSPKVGLIIWLVLPLLVLLLIYWGARFQAIGFSRASLKADSNRLTAELVREEFSNRITDLASVVSSCNKGLVLSVTGREPRDEPTTLNVLESLKEKTAASIVYTLDSNGVVTACTPYGSGKTLTGKNFAFRPYFKQAFQGHVIAYPALGVTTAKRGLYHAVPLFEDNQQQQPIGVLVVKKGLEEADRILINSGKPAALVTGGGIVFSAHDQHWLFRPLCPGVISVDDRQFGNNKKKAEPVLPVSLNEDVLRLSGKNYLAASTVITEEVACQGWRVVVLEETDEMLPVWFQGMTLVAGLGLLIVVITKFVFGNQQQWRISCIGALFSPIPASVGIISGLVTIAIFLSVRDGEEQEISNLVQEKGALASSVIQAKLDFFQNELEALVRFYEGSRFIDQQEFKAFLAPVLSKNKAIQWFVQTARVTAAKRLKHETEMNQIHSGYTIRERGPGGFQTAAGRDVYHPVVYKEPVTRLQELAGFDLSGQLAGSLAVAHSERHGLFVFACPLDGTTKTENTVTLGHRVANGFVLMQVSLAEITATSLAQLREDGIRYKVAYVGQSDESSKPNQSRSNFQVGDHQWSLTSWIPEDAKHLRDHGLSKAVLVSGLLLSLALSVLLANRVSREWVTECEVVKRTEDLHKSEASVKAILESVDTGVVVISKTKKEITYASPRAGELIGCQPAELIGRKCHGLLCAKHVGLCLFDDPGVKIGKAEGLLATEAGKEIPILKTVKHFYYQGNDCILETFVDISAQKETEVFLAEARENAEKMSQAKSNFLANMSHEIRTPLNGVIGMSCLLQETELTAEQQSYANVIRSSGGSLLRLIDDILDYSKIEAGKLELEEIDFNLRQEMDDFAEANAMKAQGKGLEVVCGISPRAPFLLRGDPGRLHQVLVNLVGNAIKFTQAGEIVIRVEPEEETERDVLLRFTVSDTGIGIPLGKQENLFTQFSQVDASTTRKYGGTGLGLAISKQLSEAMGGQIGLVSKEDHGARFWFTVRFLRSQKDAPVESGAASLANTRILIVDDNATNREVMATQLKAWDVCPEEAPDGATGMDLLRQGLKEKKPFEMALVDHRMPGINGQDFCLSVKADQDLSSTRLVIMTNLDDHIAPERLREIGAANSLTKPVCWTNLASGLSAVLRREAKSEVFGEGKRNAITKLAYSDMRILVVEDNKVNQLVALGLLKKLGLKAEIADNGVEALKALTAVSYDLVLMDCQMPIMDGWQATREIRNSQSTVLNHDVPVIAMTANATATDRKGCLDVGMNDFLTKPVKPTELSTLLKQWLS